VVDGPNMWGVVVLLVLVLGAGGVWLGARREAGQWPFRSEQVK
jgi:hypothetical protein